MVNAATAKSMKRGARITTLIHVARLMLLSLIGVGAIACHPAIAGSGPAIERYDGRDMIVIAPDSLHPQVHPALVVVLHGGFGNAWMIENRLGEAGLNLDTLAAANGFVVVYLNGTRASIRVEANQLAWNAGGGCCGAPAFYNVDDVAYIEGATRQVMKEFNIDPRRV